MAWYTATLHKESRRLEPREVEPADTLSNVVEEAENNLAVELDIPVNESGSKNITIVDELGDLPSKQEKQSSLQLPTLSSLFKADSEDKNVLSSFDGADSLTIEESLTDKIEKKESATDFAESAPLTLDDQSFEIREIIEEEVSVGFVDSIISISDDENDYEAESEKESQPGEEIIFDRDEIEDQYMEAKKLQHFLSSQNSIVQQKIIDFLLKKRPEEIAGFDAERNIPELEERYQASLKNVLDVKEEWLKAKENYKIQTMGAKATNVEKTKLVNSEFSRWLELIRKNAQSAIYSRTGKKSTLSEIDIFLSKMKFKETEMHTILLETVKVKNKLKKIEKVMKEKEELAEGLHLIDFEQLKMENQTFNEKIEERNEELEKLRKKITNAVEMLTHMREKMAFLVEKNEIYQEELNTIEAQVAQKRDILNRTKIVRDKLRQDNRDLKEKSGLLSNKPLLLDFESTLDEIGILQKKLFRLTSRWKEQKKQLSQLRFKIKMASPN